ncbi:MAG: aromatic amino acid transport family protein [Candidatus Sungbacteria bacterium]|nr:aromatic amino acid transport family protein [bacterium]MDZ4260268.1 aromatic amino acid transport family protein [Candidatus Sungbacteria bacterium]
MLKHIQAVLMLSGMIIGVGMFAIPFSFAQAGFWLGALELCVLAGIITLIHVWYGDVVLHTARPHRLPGYVRMYLGSGAATVAHISAFFGISGTLLAYVLLGGIFLHGFLEPLVGFGSAAAWSVVLIAGGAIVTLLPLKKEALINGILTVFLIVFIAVLIVMLFGHIDKTYISGFHLTAAFVPYGILLFALSGGTVIPDVVRYLKGSRRQTHQVIIAGSLIPAVVYFFFALAVMGTSGGSVSPDAIAGLAWVMGPKVVMFGNLIGFLAVITSYIVLNSSFQAFLRFDAHVAPRLAWAGGSFLPLFLFLLGFQNYISVISVVGATTVAIDAAFVIALYHRLRHIKERQLTVFDFTVFGIVYSIIVAGIGYEIYLFIPYLF